MLLDTARSSRLAFPSLAWRWIFLALWRLGLPPFVRKLDRGQLLGSNAAIVFGGSPASVAVLIARGAKQGCPTSGSACAFAFDPLVRVASYSALRAGGSFAELADDRRSSILSRACKPSSTSIANFGGHSDVACLAASLGFIFLAQVTEKIWEPVVRKCLERVAYVRRVPGHIGVVLSLAHPWRSAICVTGHSCDEHHQY